MSFEGSTLVDWAAFAQARAERQQRKEQARREYLAAGGEIPRR